MESQSVERKFLIVFTEFIQPCALTFVVVHNDLLLQFFAEASCHVLTIKHKISSDRGVQEKSLYRAYKFSFSASLHLIDVKLIQKIRL